MTHSSIQATLDHATHHYTIIAAVKQACRIIHDTDLVSILDESILYSADVAQRTPVVRYAGKGGRRRDLPYSALVGLLIMYALSQPTRMTIRGVYRYALTLRPEHLEKLGVNVPLKYEQRKAFHLSYHQIYRAFRTVAGFCDGTLIRCDHTGEITHESAFRGTVNEFVTHLLASTLPREIIKNNHVYSADSTSVYSHINARSGEYTQVPATRGSTNTKLYTGDTDAQFGHRTPTGSNPNDIFFGYHAHLVTPTPTLGGNPIPEVVSGFSFTPANAPEPASVWDAVDAMRTAGLTVTEVIADRGIAPTPAFTLSCLAARIKPVHDLKSTAFTTTPVAPGIIRHAGTLLSTGCPEKLQTLNRLPNSWDPHCAHTASERLELYRQRSAWAFKAHSHPKLTAHGIVTQRFAGPAVMGTVRCQSYPKSLRNNPADYPYCPGDNCGCGTTITLTGTDLTQIQPHMYGSWTWYQSYSRRSQIERINKELKSDDVNISGGFTWVRGTTRKALLIGIYLVGFNLRTVRKWYLTRGIQDPWADIIPELEVQLPTDLEQGKPKKAQAPPYWAMKRTPRTQEEFYRVLHKHRTTSQNEE